MLVHRFLITFIDFILTFKSGSFVTEYRYMPLIDDPDVNYVQLTFPANESSLYHFMPSQSPPYILILSDGTGGCDGFH